MVSDETKVLREIRDELKKLIRAVRKLSESGNAMYPEDEDMDETRED